MGRELFSLASNDFRVQYYVASKWFRKQVKLTALQIKEI